VQASRHIQGRPVALTPDGSGIQGLKGPQQGVAIGRVLRDVVGQEGLALVA